MFPQLLKTGLVFRNKFNVLKTLKPFNYCRILVKIGQSLGNMAVSFLLPILLMIPIISCQSPRQNLTPPSENSDPSKILMIPRWYAELTIIDVKATDDKSAIAVPFEEHHGLSWRLLEVALFEDCDELDLCESATLREAVERFLEPANPVFLALDFVSGRLLDVHQLEKVSDEIEILEVE